MENQFANDTLCFAKKKNEKYLFDFKNLARHTQRRSKLFLNSKLRLQGFNNAPTKNKTGKNIQIIFFCFNLFLCVRFFF